MLGTNTKISTMFQQILSEHAKCLSKVLLTDTVNLLFQHPVQPLPSIHFYSSEIQTLESVYLSLQISLKYHLSYSSAKYLESRNRTEI